MGGRRSVLVVGGGIAGLTHAVAARLAGHTVEVVEARPGWEVAGWGLSLTGPALRALRTLGLDDACLEAGYPIYRTLHCDEAGQVRATMELPGMLGPDRPAEAGMGRPALHRILREGAEQAGATLRTGLSITDLPPDGPIRLSDGSTRTVHYVVGADGVRSQTRARLGLPDEPHYTGQMVWRALVDRPDWATDLHTFAGPTGTTGLIPISASGAYIFLTESTDQPDTVPAEQLATRMRELLAPFGGRFAAVRETIQDPGQIVRRPVLAFFLDEPWHAGRTVLIGDAVHSPSPQMVSGAALAIEDAVVLADEVSGATDLPAAFAAFDRRRRDRARALVETSLEIGRRERQGLHHEVHALLHQGHAAMAAKI
jgi:2-polyprenyl-6-methoxyphenol hydroxylase-like FAD-dependent oxidoreductase